jgi:CHAT domain-containing protein/tetratricopeptide (TPR) repeat protein
MMASTLHIGRRIVLGVLLLLTLLFDSQSLAQSSDEAAIRKLAQSYFAAYARKDLDTLTQMWSDKSPDLAQTKARLKEFFSLNNQIETRNLSLSRFNIEGDHASALAQVEVSAIDVKTGKPSAGSGKMNRAISFAREASQWKVWRDAPAEEDLASALIAAKTDGERSALLEKGKDLQTAELWKSLISQGEKLSLRGDYPQALGAYALARTIAEQIGDKTGIVRALDLTGVVLARQGSYGLSLDLLHQSLALGESLGDKALVAAPTYHIGVVHYLQSDYELALEYYTKTLALGEASGSKLDIAASLTGIGIIHYRHGRYDLALDYYHRALLLREELGSSLGIAYALGNIGTVYHVLGNYSLALEYHQKDLALLESVGAKPDAITTLHNIGLVYESQGNYRLALEYQQKALALIEETGSRAKVPLVLTAIGNIHRMVGDYRQALDDYQKGLAVCEAVGDKQLMGATLEFIGDLHRVQGHYSEALEHYRKCLSLAEAINAKQLLASALKNIGRVHKLQGNNSLALEFTERAINLARELRKPETLWSALTIAGTAQQALNQPARARQAFEEAIATIETLRSNVAGGEQERQRFFENKLSPYQALMELLLSQNETAQALAVAERAKARVLLDVLQSGRITVSKAMSNEEKEGEAKLRGEMTLLNAQLRRESQSQTPDQARIDSLRNRLEKARLSYESFETNMYASHPALKTQRGEATRPFTVEQSVDLQDDKSAFLEYVVTDNTTFLFVLTAGVNDGSRIGEHRPELKVYDLKIKRKDLVERVNAFGTRMSNNDLEFADSAAELYQTLISPARSQLQGRSRVVIIPDDVLWETPFQALRSPKGRFLIQDVAVSYVPSLTVLRAIVKTRKPHAASSLLAMGNPKLDGRTISRSKNVSMGATFEPLPEAERMVKDLAHIYGVKTSKVYVGADAREGRLKAEASTYRVLQLATHGVINNASPMYSHVVLAQNDDSKEDGLLEAWEIMQMDLNAELTVLSACETARGRVGAGEGVIGLAWALFVAGCPTTVVSQWKVESSSTTELMLEFHRQLIAGATKSEAMRRTALKLIADKRFSHPFFWAGFIVVGDGN